MTALPTLPSKALPHFPKPLFLFILNRVSIHAPVHIRQKTKQFHILSHHNVILNQTLYQTCRILGDYVIFLLRVVKSI